MRNLPQTVPSLSGTFSIRTRFALNPEMPITNVVLKNISIQKTKEQSVITNVKNMDWENVILN